MPAPDAFLLTCEHATNRVPAAYARYFNGRKRLLDSHLGWDAGAHDLARALARRLGWTLHSGTATRLLVDLNRSLSHPRLFSRLTRPMTPQEKEAALREFYRPYRSAVTGHVQRRIAAGRRVMHLSVHSFTPVFDGKARAVEIGLLHDPRRGPERALVARWRKALADALPRTNVYFNLPYRGTADGLTRDLRDLFPAASYMGIEIEVSLRLVRGPRPAWLRLREILARTLRESLRTPS